MIRIFYEQQFAQNMQITDKDKCHHLAIVLRLQNGAEVFLVNGNDIAKCTITAISKSQIDVSLIATFKEDNELDIDVCLGFGPLKGDNTQLVIQKAVELGASQIDLINFKRNVSKFDSKKAQKKIEKFEKIIDGACAQSRRNKRVMINVNVDLDENYLKQFKRIFVCYENERANHLASQLTSIYQGEKILILIGPEGGIDATEIEFLEHNSKVQTVTLGKRILRAETASLNALSLVAACRERE